MVTRNRAVAVETCVVYCCRGDNKQKLYNSVPINGIIDGPVADAGRQPRLSGAPRRGASDGVLAATAAGLGLATLLSYQLADAPGAGRLIALLADEQPPALPVHQLFEPSRAGLPAVRAFVAAMTGRARPAGLG